MTELSRKAYLENYRTLGVDTSNVTTTSMAASGVASILVDSAGQNCITIVPGANGLLSADDVAASADTFARSRVLLTQLEVPFATTLAALRKGREAGLTNVFNPAPAPPEPLPDEVWPLCDVVCPNETETALLTGLPTETMDQCEAAARSLLAKGARAVVLTLGERGCLLVTPTASERVTIPASLRGVRVVDTVGAGDAFLGALAHALAHGSTLPAALPAAVHVASVSVQRKGAQSSYPLLKELPPGLMPSTMPSAPLRNGSPKPPAAPPAGAPPLPTAAQRTRAAAHRAVDQFARSGTVVGLGTGTTAMFAAERLAAKLSSGELTHMHAVPTSAASEERLRELGIATVSLDAHPALDLVIGGADAVDHARRVIKGGKGALLREKIVRACARTFVVAVDDSKLAPTLFAGDGSVSKSTKVHSLLPVEVAPVYAQRTLRALAALPACVSGGVQPRLRVGAAPAGLPGCALPKGENSAALPFTTDNGNWVIDLCFARAVEDLGALADQIKQVAGVVEHGLFLDLSSPDAHILVGGPDGVFSL